MNLDTLLEILEKGGFVVPPLMIGLVLMWGALGYRFALLYLGDHADARTLTRKAWQKSLSPRGILAKAAVAGAAITRGRPSALPHLLEENHQAHVAELKTYAEIITVVVRLAPLLGLLGTVTGMIATFDALADAAVTDTSGGVAGGIAEALYSTEMGLMVAVPGLILGRLLERRQTRLEEELTKVRDIFAGTPPEALS